MRFVDVLLISLCVGVVSHAVAAEPPAVPSGQSPPTAAPASAPGSPPPSPSSAPVAASTTASNTTAKTDSPPQGDASASQAKILRAAGYKPEVRNGQTVYCRKETQLGSRFESKMCATAGEVERLTARSQESIEKVQREKTIMGR